MHYAAFLTCLLVAAPALASPTKAPAPAKYCGWKNYLNQLARFENANPGIPLVAGSTVGIYDDLMYNGFTLVQVTLGTAALGVIPNTPNNMIAAGPTVAGTIQQGTAALTVTYPDSTIKSFDLHSFYYGFVLADQNGVASAPVSGSVLVTGYPSSGDPVTTTFTFTVAKVTTVQAQMVKASLDQTKFRCLTKVTFELTGALSVAEAFVADTFDYTVYGNTFLGAN